MLFITCKPIEEASPGMGTGLKAFVLDADSANNQLYYCDHKGTMGDKEVFLELGSLKFMKALREDPHKQILFYLHGFNNQPADVMYQGNLLQKLMDMNAPNECLVIPIIWPCGDKTGFVRDYWDDQKSADMSGYPLSRALSLFVQWQHQNRRDDVPCTKFMNIMAHSMGNRVLKEAMYIWGHYDSFKKVPMLFRNIFMVAADVTCDTLQLDQKGSYITYATKNTIVYYAGDDRALQGSKLINIENRQITKRLGHAGPSPSSYKVPNVYGVDCDRVNSEYDPLGHTYFINAAAVAAKENGKLNKNDGGDVFNHMLDCITTGSAGQYKMSKIKTKDPLVALARTVKNCFK